LNPPGGSELGKVFRIVGICFREGGVRKLIKGDFFAAAKPSVRASYGRPTDEIPWTDDFVEDVRRAFQACGIFSFFPLQFINDNGLGQSVNIMSNMLKAGGAPNDVTSNFNSLAIIICNPLLNYGLYPMLRRMKIHYGPVARMTTGLILSTMSGFGYTILNHYAYKQGPCGKFGTSDSCVDADKHHMVSNISLWWMAVPVSFHLVHNAG
jgi:dipeptide/tripeptide permease